MAGQLILAIAGLQKRLEKPRLFQKLWGNRGVALWQTYQLNLTIGVNLSLKALRNLVFT
jgi:hypothetical protein